MITRMRGSAIRCVRSQWERPIFAPPSLRNPSTDFDVMSNILLRPPRELMCKIWLESIEPLRICACVKKHVLCGFFLLTYLSIYLSVCLSIRFFSAATGHSFGAIFTLNGSNDVISQRLVPFGGHINIAPYCLQCFDAVGWVAGRASGL